MRVRIKIATRHSGKSEKIFGILFPLLLFVGFFGTVNGQNIRNQINQGNTLYHEEKFDEALTRYQDALLEDPRSEIGHFNQGNALYKLEKYDEAIEAYQKVIGSEERMMDQKAYYNIGNVYFQQNKLQESIGSYKKALDIYPDDHDAKYNLELARAKLKEMADKQQQPQQQQQEQNQQQQQGQDQQQQNEQGQDDQQQQQEGQEQQEQSMQEQNEQSSGNEKEIEENQQAQAEALEESSEQISKEDAERILDALKNDEQDQQKLRRPARSRRRPVDKDW